MAQPHTPPNTYPTEPPRRTSPCGWSWNQPLAVTGELEGLNYGSHLRVVLPPLAGALPEQIGKDTAAERQLLEDLAQLLGDRAQVVATSPALTSDQKQSINRLLSRAEEYFDAIHAVYQKWMNFPCFQNQNVSTAKCPWPLSWADNVGAWRSRCEEQPVSPGAVYEAYDPVQHVTQPFVCRPQAGGSSNPYAPQKRAQDRNRIRAYIVGILHHLRCAQYLSTRIVLHDRALREYREEHMHAKDFDAEPPVEPPPPGPGYGGFGTPTKPGYDPNEFLPGPGEPGSPFEEPDVDILPGTALSPFDVPLPDDYPPEESPPEDWPDASGAPEGASPSEEQDTANKWAIGLGAAALGVVLWKVLR